MKKIIMATLVLGIASIAGAQQGRMIHPNPNPMMEYREPVRIYPTIPNTTIRDYRRGDGYIIQQDGTVRPVIPWTNIPDYSKPYSYTVDDY